MNTKQFETLKAGEMVKLDNKNQIYFDEALGSSESTFIVEVFEFEEDGQNMFSVLDTFEDFDDAYNAALNPKNYLRTLEY